MLETDFFFFILNSNESLHGQMRLESDRSKPTRDVRSRLESCERRAGDGARVERWPEETLFYLQVTTTLKRREVLHQHSEKIKR